MEDLHAGARLSWQQLSYARVPLMKEAVVASVVVSVLNLQKLTLDGSRLCTNRALLGNSGN